MKIPGDFTPTALRVLRALLEEGTLTRAARRLNITPSATSRILARLRRTFNDPLLIRTASGFELTAGARAMAPHLAVALTALDQLLQPIGSDPAKFRGTVRVGISPDAVSFDFDRIFPAMMDEVPGMAFRLHALPGTALDDLETGVIDLAISLAKGESASLYRVALHTGSWVCVMRQGHPLAAGMTIDTYLAARHLVMHGWGEEGAVDQALGNHGMRRDIVLSTLNAVSAALILAVNDFILTVPSWVAEPLLRLAPLVAIPLPGEWPLVEKSLFWHARVHKAPLFIWVRRRMQELLRDQRSP